MIAKSLRSGRKNYSVQVFETMSCVHGLVGPFDIVFAAYCCGIFVPAGFVLILLAISVGDRGFKCRPVNAVNVVWCYFLHKILTLCFSVKALKTLGNHNGLRRQESKLCTASCC